MPPKQENIFPNKTISYRRKQVRINLFNLISGDYGYAIIGLEFASNIAAIRIESQEEDEEELQLKGGGLDMKTYTVYRVNYPNNKTERIGTVVDRRMGERNNNAADMLQLAQKIYTTSSIDSHIFILRDRSFHNLLLGDV